MRRSASGWRRRGHPAAAANLVIECSPDGHYDEALCWWRKARKQGILVPPADPGIKLRDSGRGPAAEGWWKVAFEKLGDLDSCDYLGIALHERGEDAEALGWWRKAAVRGHQGAVRNLAALAQMRPPRAEVTYNLGRAQLDAGNREEAAKLWRRAAADGHAAAAYNLGVLAQEHGGDDAVRWFRQAAEAGDVLAAIGLGKCTDGTRRQRRGGRLAPRPSRGRECFGDG
jgi:tetratricopeptide (TPR) repeat protein